jgi:2-dehydro-3-deoxyphosphogalactonate aldolase
MNQPTGLVAILRGVRPDEILAIGGALIDAGFTAIEVPLNSPDPFDSIERLAAAAPQRCMIGAGTVLSVDDVVRAQSAGARIMVSPNANPEVIAAATQRGLRAYPGVATPTEAFSAVDAGARSLKLFPSDAVGISGMKAWRAVLPADVEMLPVGGVDEHNLADWVAAGADGAGLGTNLYRPGDDAADVAERARTLQAIWEKARAERNPR